MPAVCLANELMSEFRNDGRPFMKRIGIVKIISGFENIESAKSACINAIKDWFKEEIK